MQINSNSNNYWLQRMQQELQSQLASMTNGLQQSPAAGQDLQAQSTGQTSSSTSGSSAATASAGSTTGAGLLGTDALNWLISSEQSTPSALASDIIQSVNPGGDSLSLQQVANATGLSPSQVSGAFSAIDGNGDGQLNASELTTALTNLQAAQDANGAGGTGGVRRHHHHHHGGGESQLAASLATDGSTTDATGSSASTSGSTSSDASTTSSGTGSTTTGA